MFRGHVSGPGGRGEFHFVKGGVRVSCEGTLVLVQCSLDGSKAWNAASRWEWRDYRVMGVNVPAPVAEGVGLRVGGGPTNVDRTGRQGWPLGSDVVATMLSKE